MSECGTDLVGEGAAPDGFAPLARAGGIAGLGDEGGDDAVEFEGGVGAGGAEGEEVFAGFGGGGAEELEFEGAEGGVELDGV